MVMGYLVVPVPSDAQMHFHHAAEMTRFLTDR